MHQALGTYERKATVTHFVRRAQTGSSLTEKMIVRGGQSPHALKWGASGRLVNSVGLSEEATFALILGKVRSVGEHGRCNPGTRQEKRIKT